MDAIQRAQIERQAREGASHSSALALPFILIVVLSGALAYFNILAGVLLLVGGCAVAAVLSRRSALDVADDDDDSQVDERPASSRGSPSSHGQFIQMGNTPQPNLLASMVHRSPVAHQPQEEPQRATPESSFDVFVADGARTIASEKRDDLKQLVKYTQEKIQIIDPILATRFHKNTQSELEIFLKAKDIVAALVQRLASMEKLLAKPNWDPGNERESWELCFGALDICRDPMSTLMSEQEVERLTLKDCATRLEAIFMRLKKRKTFYKALQKDDL